MIVRLSIIDRLNIHSTSQNNKTNIIPYVPHKNTIRHSTCNTYIYRRLTVQCTTSQKYNKFQNSCSYAIINKSSIIEQQHKDYDSSSQSQSDENLIEDTHTRITANKRIVLKNLAPKYIGRHAIYSKSPVKASNAETMKNIDTKLNKNQNPVLYEK